MFFIITLYVGEMIKTFAEVSILYSGQNCTSEQILNMV